MKTVIIYSGGLDSTVLLYDLHRTGDDVHALSINYGQRHKKEIQAAEKICAMLSIPHKTGDLSGIADLLKGSSLTNPDIEVPEGHYEAEQMKTTVVPNRNMMMLSVAAAWAISLEADTVSYAAHSGDHAIYPDCRNEFADAVDAALKLADWHSISLNRPYVDKSKRDIVARGAELKVPFADTWSCYKGEQTHCGRCGTCIERREAFHLAGIHDPTPYNDSAPTVEAMLASNWKL